MHPAQDRPPTANSSTPIVFLPGAGGENPSLAGFAVGFGSNVEFETLSYPGWRQYLSKGITVELLIADLETQIVSIIPEGPIRIVGYSLGGHFGYAAALRLQAAGRRIAGFCAIDSFMIESLEPSAGWKARALSEGLEILRKRQLGEFSRFIRSKFWRALLRMAPPDMPVFPGRNLSLGWPSAIAPFDKIFEKELTIRLLVSKTLPWIQSLDLNPVALEAPATLLRTRGNSLYDPPWRRRCPNINIIEVSGPHSALFGSDNVASLRDAFVAATREWR
jgi:pimeloyl-ACP methyl ester carboxylesterase